MTLIATQQIFVYISCNIKSKSHKQTNKQTKKVENMNKIFFMPARKVRLSLHSSHGTHNYLMPWHGDHIWNFMKVWQLSHLCSRSHMDVVPHSLTFLGMFTKLQKWLSNLSCLSVHSSARNNSTTTGCIFTKFDIQVFFENLSRKFKFH